MTGDGAIYIAGRRHSGTTFLDVLIGSTDEVESLGEIVTGLHGGPDEPTVQPGETISTSPYWQSAMEIHWKNSGRDLFVDGEWLYWKSDIRHFLSAYFDIKSINGGVWGRYTNINNKMLESLSGAADNKRILDSNKEYTRALMYLKSANNSKILHLIRHPSAVVGSHYYRAKDLGNPVGFMKLKINPGPFLLPLLVLTVGLSWTVGMIAMVLIKLRFDDRVLDVSYERLCENPARELERIGQFIDVDLDDVIEGVAAGRSFPVGNNIGGNELRLDGTFKFVPNVGGRRKVPFVYRLFTAIAASPGWLLHVLFMRPS